jgi:hypothetical protein
MDPGGRALTIAEAMARYVRDLIATDERIRQMHDELLASVERAGFRLTTGGRDPYPFDPDGPYGPEGWDIADYRTGEQLGNGPDAESYEKWREAYGGPPLCPYFSVLPSYAEDVTGGMPPVPGALPPGLAEALREAWTHGEDLEDLADRLDPNP